MKDQTGQGMSTAAQRSRAVSKYLAQVLGWGVTLICLAYVASQVQWQSLKGALIIFKWPFLLLGIFSLAIGYALRIVRWSRMLQADGARVTAVKCAAPFLASIAMNNVLPFRAGDAVRALVFPGSLGVSKTAAASSLFLERLIDLLVLLLFLAVGLVFSANVHLPARIEEAVGWLVGSVVVVSGVVVLYSGKLSLSVLRLDQRNELKSWMRKGARAIGNLLASVAKMSHLSVIVSLMGLSCLIWAGELGLFWAVLCGFGLPASLAVAALVMAIATLSTLVPSSPGYVGPFHLAAFFAVSHLGGGNALALSCALVLHLALWLPTSLAGGLALIFVPNLLRLKEMTARTDHI
jgi:uncharacterized protein (TIRG00374 family)